MKGSAGNGNIYVIVRWLPQLKILYRQHAQVSVFLLHGFVIRTSIFPNKKSILQCPPNNVGMKKRFQDKLKCTGLLKLQHCLGEREGNKV